MYIFGGAPVNPLNGFVAERCTCLTPKDPEVVMFRNSTSAPDTALPEYASVTSAEPQHSIQHRTNPAPLPDPADVEITAISPTEWRIADQAIEHDDPSALLGFIQLVGTAFEVTNLGRPRERAYFTSFDRATASLLPREVLA